MARRDGGKERFWRRAVARWRKSGVTVRDYCGAENLAETAFYYWRRELARRDGQAQEGRRKGRPLFVPVQVRHEAGSASRSPIEIVLACGRVVRVRRGFDRQLLADVLAVLEQPSQQAQEDR
jgi:transposase-like protein